jgi:glycogen synthase
MPPEETIVSTGGRGDPVGGMQNHTLELTRALDRLGVAQTVVATRLPATRARQRIGRCSEVIRLGVPINRFRQLYSLPAVRLLPILGRGADLVHAHLGEDLALLPLAVFAARVQRVPLVLTIHCSLRHTLEARDLRTSLLTSVGGRLEQWAGKRAAGVIVLSDRLAELKRCEGLAPDAIHVIAPGVDVDLFERPFVDLFPDYEGPLVVFVGRLVPEKGVRVLAHAAARLGTPNATVVFVGDGPERAALEAMRARFGLQDRIHFTGFRPHDEVPSILRRADVLVLPSLSEELGSVLLEAMSAGAAIVASRTGGIPSLVHHETNGLLVSPGDPAELAAALDRVLTDAVLAARLRSGARAHARHDWQAVGARVLEVYEAALSARPATDRQPVALAS